MDSQSRRNSKGYSGAGSENGRKGSKEATPDLSMNSCTISAPKYGTIVPERVFVGGISMSMTEAELTDFFSKYGKVIDTKIIVDRAGVSKGYGFITFETQMEAKKLLDDADNIMLRERKLNIAPAVKKQSFNQRLDVSNGAANMVGTPLFGSTVGLPFTFHNGVTYFCHHANGTPMSAPQPTTPQPPPPQSAPPSTPTTHIDPNYYTGYGSIQTPAPQYHQVVYNPPIYYQAAQYQYPITTCEAVEGSMTDGGSMQGGGMSAGNPAVGQVLLTPNGYYVQDMNPYQEYTYAHQYVYQPAPDPQPQPHHAVIQYSPTAQAPPPAPPRPLYDSPIMVPENVSGRNEIRMSVAPPKHSPPHHQSPVQPHHHPLVHHQPPPQPHHQHKQHQPMHHQQHQQQIKPKEQTPLVRHQSSVKTTPNHHPHQPDPNNNSQVTPLRPSYPLLPPNSNPLGSQVFPTQQNVYPRPPSASNPSFPHYSNTHFNNNSTNTFLRKFRRPYHPQGKGRGGGRGGGSISSCSSGGGGGGLVTPPSTPRSGQPSPDHQPAQSVASSTQDHLVHSMKTLKAA